MMKRKKHPLTALLAMTVALVALIAAASGLASAHGNAEIVITPNPATASATIEIEGEGFDEGVDVSLTLEGVSGDIALGMAVTDAEGGFHVEVTLPDAATPASYRIRVEGGDASALAGFRITQGTGGSQPPAELEAAIGFHREESVGLVFGLAGLAAFLAVAGLALLLVREKRVRTSDGA